MELDGDFVLNAFGLCEEKVEFPQAGGTVVVLSVRRGKRDEEEEERCEPSHHACSSACEPFDPLAPDPTPHQPSLYLQQRQWSDENAQRERKREREERGTSDGRLGLGSSDFGTTGLSHLLTFLFFGLVRCVPV